jgi:hypothetical protein
LVREIFGFFEPAFPGSHSSCKGEHWSLTSRQHRYAEIVAGIVAPALTFQLAKLSVPSQLLGGLRHFTGNRQNLPLYSID